MKGDVICTVRVPKLQTDTPFCDIKGNPRSIELTDKKAKIKQMKQVGEKRSRTRHL